MNRTTTIRLLYVVVALSIAGAGCHDADAVDVIRRSYPITDGVLDTGHPNVGLLLIDAQGGTAQSICTATIVGKKTLLTAAHCCKKNVNILFELNKKVHQVVKVIPHPSWTSLYKHDIGLAILKDPLTVTPALAGTVGPVKGMTITMVGFGRTSTSVKDSGKKRKANNTIAGVASGYFTVTGTGNGKGNTCTGDSGGPTLTQGGKVVGVIPSASEKTCGLKSWHVSVKTYLSWLKSKAGGDFYPYAPVKKDGAAPKQDGAATKQDAGGSTADSVFEAALIPDLKSTFEDTGIEDGPRGNDDGCRLGAGRIALTGGAPLLLLALLLVLVRAGRRRR